MVRSILFSENYLSNRRHFMKIYVQKVAKLKESRECFASSLTNLACSSGHTIWISPAAFFPMPCSCWKREFHWSGLGIPFMQQRFGSTSFSDNLPDGTDQLVAYNPATRTMVFTLDAAALTFVATTDLAASDIRTTSTRVVHLTHGDVDSVAAFQSRIQTAIGTISLVPSCTTPTLATTLLLQATRPQPTRWRTFAS